MRRRRRAGLGAGVVGLRDADAGPRRIEAISAPSRSPHEACPGSLYANCGVGLEGVSRRAASRRPPAACALPRRRAASYPPGGGHEEAAPAARPGPATERLRPDRRLRRRRGRGTELRRRDGDRRHVAGARRDLHARARRSPEHRRVGGWHGRRLGGGTIRGGSEGLLRAVSSERDDGRERLQHDRRRCGGAPGRRRHPFRRAGGDPGRNRAGRDPGGRAPRSRRGVRRAVLAIAGPGEGRVRAAEGDLRRRSSPPAKRGTRPA